ncbi:hypothetical protein N2152v2_001445 [Parachlorella kessleri]
MASKKWIPLESNPDVLNDFGKRLGLDTSLYCFCDVYGFDQDLLAMVPKPVLAVLLLFPITDSTEAAQQERIEKEGQTVSNSVYYMKQTIGNACGTIGLLHAAGNNLDQLQLGKSSFLTQFFESTASMNPQERGAYLEHPPQGAPSIDSIHEAAAQQGQTAAPNAEEEVDLHFVAFVCRDGSLYELDGRKAGPINHGPSSPESLLEDAAAVVKREFVDKSESINFVSVPM